MDSGDANGDCGPDSRVSADGLFRILNEHSRCSTQNTTADGPQERLTLPAVFLDLSVRQPPMSCVTVLTDMRPSAMLLRGTDIIYSFLA